jgi:hypothetical protein
VPPDRRWAEAAAHYILKIIRLLVREMLCSSSDEASRYNEAHDLVGAFKDLVNA